MTEKNKTSRINIRAKLILLNIYFGIACILVLASILYSFNNVRLLVTQVTDHHMSEVTENSKTARDLSRIFSDINRLISNFYGQEAHLTTEGARITDQIHKTVTSTTLTEIKKNLETIQIDIQTFLEECRQVNNCLHQRSVITASMNAALDQLENSIAEKTIGQTQDDANTVYSKELSPRILGYREEILRIEKINAEIGVNHFKSTDTTTTHPLIFLLDELKFHILPLTTSPAPLAAYAQQISLAIKHYKQNILTLHTRMSAVSQDIEVLASDKSNLLREMAILDTRTAQSTQDVYQNIEEIIYQSRMVVLVIFIVTIFVIGFVTFHVFTSHVQIPLRTIIQGIRMFRQGDFSYRITMDRKDEWADIQEALNSMAEEVQASYQALKISETNYRSIVNNAFDGIFQLDMDGKIRNANPAMAKILGYASQQELITQHGDAMSALSVDPDHHFPLLDFLKTHKNLRQHETPVFRPKRPPIWITLNARHVTTVDEIYIEGTMADVTDRKNSEMELEYLRIYLDNIINSMPSILIGIDKNEKITQWNREAEIQIGIQAHLALGKHLTKALPQLTSETIHLGQAISRKQIKKTSKITFSLGEKSKLVDITVFPLITNTVEGAVIRIDDISERVRIEEMMIQSEKMLSVGGLAAGMAHEINNPLAGILQAAQVLEMRLSEDLPKNAEAAMECGTNMHTIREYMVKRRLFTMLDSIRKAGERAAKIVDNMLSFSRKGSAETTRQSLPELMDATIELAENDYDLKKNYDFRQIEITRDYEEELPLIDCETSKIQQVFLNLLKNGSQAMAEQITRDPSYCPKFTIGIHSDGDYIQISIQDNGPGMDESVRKRVFEPFFTTKEVGSGTGLGLSVSYFIITDNHNGMMYVESLPEKGTKFVIKLPINQKRPAL